MKRLLLLAITAGCFTGTAVTAAESALPERYGYFGAHAARYHLDPDAYGSDFIEDVDTLGLQAGYRFPVDLSVQIWWERNNTRTAESRRKVDLNLAMATLRRHSASQVLGVEPYAGLGAGELMYENRNSEDDDSFMSLELGFQRRIKPHWVLDIGARAPYSFGDDRWDTEFYIGLNNLFGLNRTAQQSRPDAKAPLVTPQPTLRDSDRDGVPDTIDECPGSPAGSRVDSTGCQSAPATP